MSIKTSNKLINAICIFILKNSIMKYELQKYKLNNQRNATMYTKIKDEKKIELEQIITKPKGLNTLQEKEEYYSKIENWVYSISEEKDYIKIENSIPILETKKVYNRLPLDVLELLDKAYLQIVHKNFNKADSEKDKINQILGRRYVTIYRISC